MITYILIFVLYSTVDGSITTFNQEFSSATNCEFAGTNMAKTLVDDSHVRIISKGCFKK